MKTISHRLLSSSAILLAMTAVASAQSQPMSVREDSLPASNIQGMTAPKYSKNTPMGGVDYGDDLGSHTATKGLDMSTFGIYNLRAPETDRPDMAANKAYVDDQVAAGKDNLGNHTAQRNIIMGGHQIEGLGAPTTNTSAATKKYVDDQVAAGKDNLGNHLATTDLDMDSNRIVDVADPVNASDAANKAYVDSVGTASQDNLGNHIATLDLNMSGRKITNLADPSAPTDAATKNYVDSATSTINNSIGAISNRRINAGTGLTGGGPLTGDVSIGFDQGWGDGRYVRNTVQVIAGNGLTGGGALTANRTLALDGTVVRTTGSQDIAGDKTFTDGIDNGGNTLTGVGSPSANTDAANKGYVDTQISTSVSAAAYTAGSGLTLTAREFAVDDTIVATLADTQTISGRKTFSQPIYLSNATNQIRIGSTLANAHGVMLHNSGNDLQFRATAPGSAETGAAVLTPLRINLSTGRVTMSGETLIQGSAQINNGLSMNNTKISLLAEPTLSNDAATLNTVISRLNPVISDVTALKGRTISTNDGITGGGDLSANRTIGLTGQALALHNVSSNGFLVRTGTSAASARSIVATANGGVSVVNGDGVAGNPTLTVDSSVVRTTGNQSIGGSKTFTAAIAMSNQKITGLATPTDTADAATKGYVDTQIAAAGGASYIAGSGLTLTGSTFAVDGTVIRTTTDQTIGGRKTFTSEPHFGTTQIRIMPGASNSGRGALLRNDGAHFYLLATDDGQAVSGTWNGLRPFMVNMSNGFTEMNNGIRVTGGAGEEGSFYSGGNNPWSQWRLNFNGSLFATRYYSTMYLYFSDRNLKKDIETLTPELGIETVRKINPVTYRWKRDNTEAWGVIAQEIQEVMPQAVKDSGNGTLAVDYQQIIAPMLAAIQELDERAAASDARVKDLEERLLTIEGAK